MDMPAAACHCLTVLLCILVFRLPWHCVQKWDKAALLQIRPLEEAYKFGNFFSSLLTESDFEAKPSVLLLGQYSTGKTTFIKHLLGRDYPGIHIGPEPTTGQPSCHVLHRMSFVSDVFVLCRVVPCCNS